MSIEFIAVGLGAFEMVIELKLQLKESGVLRGKSKK
jgi:hypothetical protein|tara:strand:+ start:146 stop:253 length:108 start_codon:yes stop_codon:yes gene_type:complete